MARVNSSRDENGDKRRRRDPSLPRYAMLSPRMPEQDNRLSPSARGYGRRWNRVRVSFLRRNFLCVMCAARGRVEAARVVDHIVPHKGDRELFWDTSNWQALCTACHNKHKQRMEIDGYDHAIDADGWPTD